MFGFRELKLLQCCSQCTVNRMVVCMYWTHITISSYNSRSLNPFFSLRVVIYFLAITKKLIKLSSIYSCLTFTTRLDASFAASDISPIHRVLLYIGVWAWTWRHFLWLLMTLHRKHKICIYLLLLLLAHKSI